MHTPHSNAKTNSFWASDATVLCMLTRGYASAWAWPCCCVRRFLQSAESVHLSQLPLVARGPYHVHTRRDWADFYIDLRQTVTRIHIRFVVDAAKHISITQRLYRRRSEWARTAGGNAFNHKISCTRLSFAGDISSVSKRLETARSEAIVSMCADMSGTRGALCMLSSNKL